MRNTKPRLFADAAGVWWERTPGHPSGLGWGEIYSVGGRKLNGITEVYTCVELGTEYGDFIELYHDWPGFTNVIATITERLPGVAPNWYQRVERLGISDPPIEVWHR